ncbi:MAG: class I mannose-6-phosphate isomerase, partial [Leifsonia sp.]
PLAAGDTLLVPAGLAHAIGPGVTLVELQQPTDLSVLLERRTLTPAEALLGLDLDTAIGGLVRDVTPEERIHDLRQRRGAETLFPADADPFFAAERLHVSGSRELEPGFSVVVVLDGTGSLETATGSLPLRRGSTVLTAYGDGPLDLSGELDVIRCRPPQ